MDRGPLFPSMDATQVLGAFDPLALSLSFVREPIHSGRTPPEADLPEEDLSEIRVVPVDLAAEPATQLLGDVAIDVVAHELTHLYQVTATSSGLRHFLDLHEYVTICQRLIAAAAGRAGGTLPVGLLGTRAGAAGRGPVGDALGILSELFSRRVVRSGGLHIPLAALAPYRTATDYGSLFQVRGIFSGDDVVWCLDLTDLDGPAGTAVTLGDMHLYEGQALLVEYSRALRASHRRPTDEFVSPLDTAPVHPYHLAALIYRAICRPAENRLWMVEATVIIDAALMADDWATVPIERLISGTYEWTLTSAIDVFIRMCHALADHPEWTLTTHRPDEVVSFQDRLLQAVGAPVPSVERLTAALLDRYPTALGRVANRNPLFVPTLGSWRRAFAMLLTDRATNSGGGSAALPFAMQSDAALRRTAMKLATTVWVRPPPITDGTETDDRVFVLYAAHHLVPVIDAILYGQRPCDHRPGCTLPRRAACSGLPSLDQIEPAGRRCPREGALTMVMDDAGITELTP